MYDIDEVLLSQMLGGLISVLRYAFIKRKKNLEILRLFFKKKNQMNHCFYLYISFEIQATPKRDNFRMLIQEFELVESVNQTPFNKVLLLLLFNFLNLF